MNARSKVYLSPRVWYLRVNIIKAQNLVPKKKRIPEVFVKATLGNSKLRTRVSSDKSVNPRWNEYLMFVATEPFYDPLILTMEDKLGNNEEESLGRCVIHPSKVYKRWLPEPIGEKCSDYKAAHKALWTPTIGVLELGIIGATGFVSMKSRDRHKTTDAYFVAKYGPNWLDSLRQQATISLSLWLRGNEPPLRKEVVERMLDARYQMWSPRRGKANLQRLIAALNVFVEAWKWFNEIQLDIFPSSKQGDVLRMRYDQLKSIVGRAMIMISSSQTYPSGGKLIYDETSKIRP
ncbi:hypothetical protein REPUB_Repub17cG0195600 [Reevesia pubescens]